MQEKRNGMVPLHFSGFGRLEDQMRMGLWRKHDATFHVSVAAERVAPYSTAG